MPRWVLPHADLVLGKDEVHIWRSVLKKPESRIQDLHDLLSEDERLQASRFHFQKHRSHYIIARGMLRTVLGRYQNLDPRQLSFHYGRNGKPALANDPGLPALEFNLAHSHGLALFAVTRDQEVGIDVEFSRRINDIQAIADRFFSQRERTVLRDLPIEQRTEAFFNCWTRKEAFLKANGQGITEGLDQIEVSLAPGEPAKLLSIGGDREKANSWSLHAFIPAPDYVAALVVKTQSPRQAFWECPE